MLIIYFFKSSDHLKRFQSYLNSGYINMSSTIETEQSNKNIQQVYIENQLLVVYLAIPIVFIYYLQNWYVFFGYALSW